MPNVVFVLSFLLLLILFFSSSPVPIPFFAVVVSLGRFFSERLGRSFALYCNAPRIDLVLYLMSVVLFVKWFSFLLVRISNVFGFFVLQPSILFRKKFQFFSLDLYPAS